jgi:Zn-dependent membrane protease YugP
VEAVAPEALERLDEPPVVGVEAIGMRERAGSRELGEHLSLAWRGDLQLVEEGRDRIVVAREEPKPLERVVEHLVDVLRIPFGMRRFGPRGDRTTLLPFSHMGNWGLYFIFLIPPLIIGFVVQHWLKKTVAANLQVDVMNGLSGAEVARRILDANGLQGVPVETSPGGPLSDHYDPRTKSVHLSEPVYRGRAVASTAIAAHEVGHAIQHAKAYAPFRLRSAMWPAVAFASNAWIFLLMIGAFAQLFGLITFAILLYAVVVLFQLVTLPVEFDASRRAMSQLHELGLVAAGEAQGARKVLTAAAMTYVAAALAALSQLAYYALVFLGNRS